MAAEVVVLRSLRYGGRTEPIMKNHPQAFISFNETENGETYLEEDAVNSAGDFKRVENGNGTNGTVIHAGGYNHDGTHTVT
jgi:hypothetical protein